MLVCFGAHTKHVTVIVKEHLICDRTLMIQCTNIYFETTGNYIETVLKYADSILRTHKTNEVIITLGQARKIYLLVGQRLILLMSINVCNGRILIRNYPLVETYLNIYVPIFNFHRPLLLSVVLE
jgi:hypothetical protein